MNQLFIINRAKLRVAHQSEVLQLRRALMDAQAEILKLKNKINSNIVDEVDRKLILSSNGQQYVVSRDDIIYCEADGSYTKVFIRDKYESRAEQSGSLQASRKTVTVNSQTVGGSTRSHRVFLSKSIKYVIELISSDDFIRCHQSYLINKKYVRCFDTKKGLFVQLSNGQRIPVSRRNKKRVLDAI